MTKTGPIAVTLLLMGCSAAGGDGGPYEDYTIAPVALRVTNGASVAFRQAATRWEVATGLAVDFVPGGATIRAMPMDDIAVACAAEVNACTFITEDQLGRRALSGFALWEARVGDSAESAIWTHEIGHALLKDYGPVYDQGPSHHAIPGIMAEWWSGVITSALLDVVCAYNDCTRYAPEDTQ